MGGLHLGEPGLHSRRPGPYLGRDVPSSFQWEPFPAHSSRAPGGQLHPPRASLSFGSRRRRPAAHLVLVRAASTEAGTSGRRAAEGAQGSRGEGARQDRAARPAPRHLEVGRSGRPQTERSPGAGSPGSPADKRPRWRGGQSPRGLPAGVQGSGPRARCSCPRGGRGWGLGPGACLDGGRDGQGSGRR